MGTFSEYSTSNSSSGRENLFSLISGCLRHLITKGGLTSIRLRDDVESDDGNDKHRGYWCTEQLVLRDGMPVASICIRVQASEHSLNLRSLKDLLEQRMKPSAPAKPSMAADLGERLKQRLAAQKAEEKTDEEKKPEKSPTDLFCEDMIGRAPLWSIIIVHPGAPKTAEKTVEQTGVSKVMNTTMSHINHGAPFDFQLIEESFEYLIDVLTGQALTQQSPTPQA
jgi:hypothetical protein